MRDVELGISVVEAGATVVRNRFGSNLSRLDKGAGDFATNADIEAEQAMLDLLRHHRPQDAVLGEEGGRTGPGDSRRVWLVDPLCGTLNYAARMRVVAVNAALKEGDETAVAAVADPFNDEIYWTDGDAAWARSGGRDAALAPSGDSNLVDLNFDPPFPSAPGFTAVGLAADPDFVANFRPRVVSSSLALAWVATGQRAAYITDGDRRDSVHFAAGIALCGAAGCVVTDLRGDAWGLSPTGLLAAAIPETHAKIHDMVRKRLI